MLLKPNVMHIKSRNEDDKLQTFLCGEVSLEALYCSVNSESDVI